MYFLVSLVKKFDGQTYANIISTINVQIAMNEKEDCNKLLNLVRKGINFSFEVRKIDKLLQPCMEPFGTFAHMAPLH